MEENFIPITPGERSHLFAAAVKLLQFALRAVTASAEDDDVALRAVSASAPEQKLTEEEVALLKAILPLLRTTMATFWLQLLPWSSPFWKDGRTTPSVESSVQAKPEQQLQ